MFHSTVRQLSVSEWHYENGNLKKRSPVYIDKKTPLTKWSEKEHNNDGIYEKQTTSIALYYPWVFPRSFWNKESEPEPVLKVTGNIGFNREGPSCPLPSSSVVTLSLLVRTYRDAHLVLLSSSQHPARKEEEGASLQWSLPSPCLPSLAPFCTGNFVHPSFESVALETPWSPFLKLPPL